MPKTTTDTADTTASAAQDERVECRVLTVLDYGTDATDQRRYQPGETVHMRPVDIATALALGAIAPLAPTASSAQERV